MELIYSYKGIRIFDYPKWAEPLREDIRVHAEAVAKDAGLKIDFIRPFRRLNACAILPAIS